MSSILLVKVMSQRRVLAVNHVFSVLLHVANGDSWPSALMAAMPQRRGAMPQLDDADEAHGMGFQEGKKEEDAKELGGGESDGTPQGQCIPDESTQYHRRDCDNGDTS